MKFVLSILSFVLLLSCTKQKQHTNEIIKVELDRSGAWSDYGSAIIVDSSLTYKYCDDNLEGGYFIGKIDRRFWDTLNRKLEIANFRAVDSIENMNAYDAEYLELIIRWKNKKRRIIRIWAGNDPISTTCRWLDSSSKKVRLQPIKTPIIFEGEFQKKPRPPFRNLRSISKE